MSKSYDLPHTDFPELADMECNDACAKHAPSCDGFCDHLAPHTNACLEPNDFWQPTEQNKADIVEAFNAVMSAMETRIAAEPEQIGDALERILTVADDHEYEVIREVAVRAGLLWRCSQCAATFGHDIKDCEFCEPPLVADPDDLGEDVPAAWTEV